MAITLDQFEHPAWLSAVGTVLGYGIILILLTIVLFVVPFLLFSL